MPEPTPDKPKIDYSKLEQYSNESEWGIEHEHERAREAAERAMEQEEQARKQQEEAENVMIDGKTVECPICACSRCRASGARPAKLGCGTLFLIGIVVAVFSGGGTGGTRDMKREVRDLRSEVGDLKKAVEAQSSEIREFRDRLPPPPAKAGDGKAAPPTGLE